MVDGDDIARIVCESLGRFAELLSSSKLSTDRPSTSFFTLDMLELSGSKTGSLSFDEDDRFPFLYMFVRCSLLSLLLSGIVLTVKSSLG